MNIVRMLAKAIREDRRRLKIVKPSPRVDELISVLRRPVSLNEPACRSVEVVTSKMQKRTGPHPDTCYNTIAEHFGRASSSRSKLALLQQLITFRDSKCVLEVGTGYGLSAIAMAQAEQNPKVVTIDFPEPQSSIGPENIRLVGATNVECIKQDKVEALPRLAREGRRFDFVFHDGGHTGDSYISDFSVILPMLDQGSIYLVDDIAWDSARDIRKITQRSSTRTCFEGWQELLTEPSIEGAVVVNHSVGILLTR